MTTEAGRTLNWKERARARRETMSTAEVLRREQKARASTRFSNQANLTVADNGYRAK